MADNVASPSNRVAEDNRSASSTGSQCVRDGPDTGPILNLDPTIAPGGVPPVSVSPSAEEEGSSRKFTPRITEMQSSIDESDILYIRNLYKWSRKCELLIPASHQRVHTPPEGYFSMYFQHVRNGFRYPAPEGVCNVLNRFSLCPAQVHPNAVAQIVALHWLCRNVHVDLTQSIAHHIFTPYLKYGTDHITFHTGADYRYFEGKTSSVKDFKPKFFYIRLKEEARFFRTSWNFSDFHKMKGDKDPLSRQEMADLSFLQSIANKFWNLGGAIDAYTRKRKLATRDGDFPCLLPFSHPGI